LLFALVIAVGLTLIFALLYRNVGSWALWWMFSLLIFLAARAGGVWITPVGPKLFGQSWLPFLLAGLFLALLLASAPAGSHHYRNSRRAWQDGLH
jgi:hypothetical protein